MDLLALHSLQKRLNYVKLVFLFLDVGASVLVKTLVYLYKGPTPPETYLVDVANFKSNNIYPVEKDTLEKLKKGELKIGQLDITLTYKLLQLSCGLTDRNSSEGKLLWSNNCPKDKKHCLENLIFRYKEIRNRIIHDFKNLEELYDDAFDKIKVKSEALLNSIVVEVGIEASLPAAEIENWQQELNSKINVICLWDIQGSQGTSKDDFDRQIVVVDFSDDDYDDQIPKFKKTNKKVNEKESKEKQKDQIERKEIRSELPGWNEDLPTKALKPRARNKSKSISFPFFKDRKINVKGDLIKRDILARYGNELPDKNLYQNLLQNRKPAGPSPFTKSNRNYWIDRLLTTNVLDNDVTLQRFVEEYSKDQRETNRISSIIGGITSRF